MIPAVAGCLQERDAKGADSDTKPVHLVPVRNSGRGYWRDDDTAATLGTEARSVHEGTLVVAFERRFVRTSGGQPNDTGVHPCLRADTNTGDGAPCVAFSCKDHGAESAVQEVCRSADVQAQPAHAAMQVRRLTAREAERLQGFQWRCSPTDHEAWQDELGRWWSPDYTADFSDSVRYRMLGNAVCVNVAEWIAKRLVKEVRREQA